MCKRLCKIYEQTSDISLTRYMFDFTQHLKHKRSPDETWLQHPAGQDQGKVPFRICALWCQKTHGANIIDWISDWTLTRKTSNKGSKTTAEKLEPDWFLELGLSRSFLTCSVLNRDLVQLQGLCASWTRDVKNSIQSEAVFACRHLFMEFSIPTKLQCHPFGHSFSTRTFKRHKIFILVGTKKIP